MQCILGQKAKSKKSTKYFISLSPIKSSYLPRIPSPMPIQEKNLSPQYTPQQKLSLPKLPRVDVTDIKSPANKKNLPEFYKNRLIQFKQALTRDSESPSTESNHQAFTEKNSQLCLVF
ncbi:hypothetical protein SteCoe_14032 [Stentor coeruleus]|uniref:Uncharacterized protein n=1 Tax=Stentor coeruleus TaxID=5963 RepID=A0A1R2C6Y7_9CILI|nr:hypothetical protein SteCoe_14032 [Stentor coeruleus]